MPRPALRRTAQSAKAALANASSKTTVEAKCQTETASELSDDLYDEIDDSRITKINSSESDKAPIIHHEHHPNPDVEVSRRDRTPPRQTFGDMTGLDLDDDMFAIDTNLDSSFEYDPMQSTTSATKSQNSSFAMGTFRRRGRSRTSSFVGGTTNSVRPSSRSHNMTGLSNILNLQNFKRREREPSILGTAQKLGHFDSEGNDSTANLEESIEQDKSTKVDPINEPDQSPLRRKSRRPSDISPSSSEIDVSSFLSRKRKFSDAHQFDDNEGERSSKAPSLEPDNDSAPVSIDGLSSAPPSPRSPSPVIPAQNDVDESKILAPPASSDDDDIPSLPPMPAPSRRRHALHSHRTPPRMTHDDSDISSPPSLTHSPNHQLPPRAAKRAHTRKQHREKLPTTADLATMLARRRHRHKLSGGGDEGGSEMGSNSESTIDDENDAKYGEKLPVSRKKQGAASKENFNHGRAGTHLVRKRPRKTYGKSLDNKSMEELEERSDIEGDEAPADEEHSLAPMRDIRLENGSEDSELLERRIGTELKNARRKFQEVDQWNLCFEEVTRSSSPAGAR